jgi:4-diphosphocytidyl-2-C-methyl-D-erythritol kinase
VISFPPAKINLGLSIQAKRSDGYHEIVSVMLPIPLVDILEVQKSDTFSFVQTGLTLPKDGKLNLCEQAFLFMQERYSIGNVRIHLRKQIPFGAGLGGGSSDAAYVLKAVDELFDLNLPSAELENLAAQLGSDCPFFIDSKPKLANGRGEILSPISNNLSGYRLVVLNPKIHVSTAFAYAQIQPTRNTTDWILRWDGPINEWQDHLINDFEEPICGHFPLIAEIIQDLKNQGAIYAAMSGSGSSVFGIFDIKTSPQVKKYQDFLLLNVIMD